ncbi:DUF4450 domain-containing protein [Alistipes sp.]|uniref:DUF4450 domain-containing protein n=1 Tax=Alistipes sp. TaxID=1872444 RepID=UPI003AEF7C3B
MKRTICLLLAAALPAVLLQAQSVKPARLNEDYTYNLTSGSERPLHYRPAGDGSVAATDGTARFNRALYGAHTGFRVECSDYPEFGLYLPRMGGNLQLDCNHITCEARYTPGRMDYSLDEGRIRIEVQVRRSEDAALWRIANGSESEQRIGIRFGGVADKKFYREGDLGVDRPDCFDLKPEYCAGNTYEVTGNVVKIGYGAKERKTLTLVVPTESHRITELPAFEGEMVLAPGEKRCIALFPADVAPRTEQELPALLTQAERERTAIASTLSISTPDPWIDPIGGALAVAADGIWSGRAWLHGAIGWRTPHLGWRGAYVGDAIGWHDRARTHFDTYAANQVTDIEPVFDHPRQDSALNLARAEKRWGTPMYSNGYICRRPGKKDEMSHYDMNLVYIDALVRHLRHTGDTACMRRIFPVIERHLAWEKRNFDPDGDHLYDAYCCIWASDALYYAGGAVTHASAYNYFANREAARIACRIGLDGTPYRAEADSILAAMHRELWLPDEGHWAEYRDLGGHRRVHPSAAVWTIYHALDSETTDPLRAWASTRYLDERIPRIPLRSRDFDEGAYHLVSTTDWKPYSWSINNVAIAEVMHTALAYWQADRPEEAFRLMKSVAMDNMYLGTSPLNFGQISHLDAARGECYRDFADPVGVWSRALTEGLFGIRPDRIGERPAVELRPGFPAAWDHASIALPQIAYTFERTQGVSTYRIENRYGGDTRIWLVVAAEGLRSVRVNGREAAWSGVENSVGVPRIRIDAGTEPVATVVIDCSGPAAEPRATSNIRFEGDIAFHEVTADGLAWWLPEEPDLSETPAPENGFTDIRPELFRTVDLAPAYNASVTDIFRSRYLSPRPACTTLQLPVQGIGEWCHPTETAEIDDSGLRAAIGADGLLQTAPGIAFRLPREGRNILFTSLWDNYPDRAAVPLSGRAAHAYLLLAGSTNHMQCRIANGVVRIRYADGTEQTTELVNPDNWAPVEQDFYYDAHAFAPGDGWLPPYRLYLGSGRMSRTLGDELGIDGVYGRRIDGGAGVVLDIALDPSRELKELELETLSNDVVIGLMAVTLQNPEP